MENEGKLRGPELILPGEFGVSQFRDFYPAWLAWRDLQMRAIAVGFCLPAKYLDGARVEAPVIVEARAEK